MRRLLGLLLVLLLAPTASASAQSTALVEKAAGRPAIASSVQGAGLAPARAIDGSGSTRWGSAYADGQWWQVDLGSARAVSQVSITWEAAYAPRYRISTSTDGVSFTTAAEVTASSAGTQTTSFAVRDARHVRVTGLGRVNPAWGISFWEAKVLGPADTPATGGGTDRAAGRPTSASNTASYSRLPQFAVDGDPQTGWTSIAGEWQWWQVDLGSAVMVDRVAVTWEAAYASRYLVLTSTDGAAWSTSADVSITKPGVHETTFAARAARFVRIVTLVRASTASGVSFSDVKVFGTPAPAPAPTVRAELKPPGTPVLGDAEAAARVKRSPWEPRPANTDENTRVPTAAELSSFFAQNKTWGACHEALQRRVTGNFTGTTDEILQWGAHKWGLDEDVLRAVAVKESWWGMSFVGDNGDSYGLMQVRRSAHGGTNPIATISTAFNVDYYGAHIRQYYDGCADWMRDRGAYARGDIWGSIGAWFSGGWHDGGATTYLGQVRDILARRTWSTAGF